MLEPMRDRTATAPATATATATASATATATATATAAIVEPVRDRTADRHRNRDRIAGRNRNHVHNHTHIHNPIRVHDANRTFIPSAEHPPAMYDSVVFDLDGVLLRHHDDGPDVFTDAVAEAFRTFDADPPPSDIEVFVGTATLDGMREVCERHGVDFEAFWPERERRVSALQQQMMERGERVLYDDCSVLSELAASHALGVVSNNQHETVAFMVDHFGLDDRFDAVYGRDPTVEGFRRTKPDVHYVERALADLDTRSALFVGDSVADVLAAHEAGLDSVFVRRDHREGYDLPEDPTYEVDRLTGLDEIVREA